MKECPQFFRLDERMQVDGKNSFFVLGISPSIKMQKIISVYEIFWYFGLQDKKDDLGQRLLES